MATNDERYFALYGGGHFAGLGKDLCRVCGTPTRDHRIGPCPMLGMAVIHGVHAGQVTSRTVWRNGGKPVPRPGATPQVRTPREGRTR